LKTAEDRILTWALLVVAALYCITPVYSENLFWHMRNGEDILDTGTIRTSDTLTWTAHGRVWIQQEWLAEVLFAAAWRLAGSSGLMVLKSAAVLAGLAMAFSAARRHGARASGIVIMALMWLSVTQARWFERPHIFTDVYFAACLLLLTRAGRMSLPAKLAVFIPFQVLWTNTHAGFVMGPFLLSMPLVDAIAGRRWKDLPAAAALPLAALAACGIHPNGFGSLSYLPDFLSQPLYRETIREWWSPFDPRYGTARTAVTLVVLSLLSAVLILLRGRRRISPSQVFVLAALTVSSTFAARNMELLALASIAFVAPLLPAIRWPVPAALLAAAAAVPPLLGIPREYGPPRAFGVGIDWSIYPVGLADFLEEQGIRGRVFNTNEISGYLEYRFGESLPLYMDGRCLLYPQHFYAEYLLLAQSPDTTAARTQLTILRARGIDLALFDWPSQRGSVANLLAELPDWAPVYWDSLTVAYARLDLLDSLGLRDLAFEFCDPLSPEELLERPLYEIPSRLLPEMRRASDLAGWRSLPASTACCLLWRSGRREEAMELASSRSAGPAGDGLISAMRADTAAELALPAMSTLLAWALIDRGDFEGAMREARASGDTFLGNSVAILAGAGHAPAPQGPPQWVPEGVFAGYLDGSMSQGEMLAVDACAALAAGMGCRAESLASVCLAREDVRPWAVSACARVLACAGDDGGAVAASAAALERSVNPVTLGGRAAVESAAGRYGTAAGFLGRAAGMAPSSAMIRLELAACLWRTGDMDASALQYAAAADLGAQMPPSARSRMSWATSLSTPGVDTPAGGGQF